MELLILYLWMKLDGVIAVSITVGVLSLIFAVVCAIAWTESREEENKVKCNKYFKNSIKTSVFLFVVAFITPSQTQTAVLVGGYYAKEALTSPEGQKVISVLRKKANEYLDKELAGK